MDGSWYASAASPLDVMLDDHLAMPRCGSKLGCRFFCRHEREG